MMTFLKSKENARCLHGVWGQKAKVLVQNQAGSHLVSLTKPFSFLVAFVSSLMEGNRCLFLCLQSSYNIANSKSLRESSAMSER